MQLWELVKPLCKYAAFVASAGPRSAGRSWREEGHEVWEVKDKVKPAKMS